MFGFVLKIVRVKVYPAEMFNEEDTIDIESGQSYIYCSEFYEDFDE